MPIQRTISVIAAIIALALAGTVTAFAHAHLVRATPTANSTVGKAPSEVTLRFSEKLESAFNSVIVRDSAGKQVDKGDVSLDKADRTLLRISLPPLASGVYKVEWRAVSADSHKIEGNFTFRVGE